MAAVLDAANELFAARGPASVSVRDIAAAARVNHALVHRHFGPKHKVLQAVLERSARGMATVTDRVTEARAGMEAVFNAAVEHQNYWRALARAVLDGESARGLQRDFPTINRLTAMLMRERTQAHPDRDQSAVALESSVVVAVFSALILGWTLFEPFLIVATGLDRYKLEKVRTWIVHVFQSIVDAPLDLSTDPTDLDEHKSSDTEASAIGHNARPAK
jgi:AcrR family transcriptional regulator